MRGSRLIPIGIGILIGLSSAIPSECRADERGPGNFQTITALIAALDDDDQEIRKNLAIALAKFCPESIEPLKRALRDRSPYRRAGAAEALGLMGTAAEPALTSLIESLADKDREVRRQVSFAISQIVPDQRVRPPGKMLAKP